MLLGLMTALLVGTAPQVTAHRVGQLLVIREELVVQAPPEVVWAVVTDYPHLPRFISSVRSSRARPVGTGVEVDQVIAARVLFFSRDLHLKLLVQERPYRRVDFRDIERRDFKVYSGSWEIAPGPDGTHVINSVNAIPYVKLPEGVGLLVLKASAEQFLGQLEQEILRRSQQLERKRP